MTGVPDPLRPSLDPGEIDAVDRLLLAVARAANADDRDLVGHLVERLALTTPAWVIAYASGSMIGALIKELAAHHDADPDAVLDGVLARYFDEPTAT